MTVFLNSQELAKGISNLGESIEYLKVLYENHLRNPKESLVDEKSLKEHENNLRSLKWGIVSYLSNPSNYNDWIQAPNNKDTLLFKYMNQGHLLAEIGPDEDLKNKIISDIKNKFEQTDPQELLTNAEKGRIKHAEKNDVPSERVYKYEKESNMIVGIIDNDKCFDKQFKATFNSLNKSLLPKNISDIVTNIEKNSVLLKDHPRHSMVNPLNTETTVGTEQLRDLINGAIHHDDNSLNAFLRLQQSYENIAKKNPHVKVIKSIREQYQAPAPDAPKLG